MSERDLGSNDDSERDLGSSVNSERDLAFTNVGERPRIKGRLRVRLEAFSLDLQWAAGMSSFLFA